MFTKEEKWNAKKMWFKAIFGKFPYVLLCYVFYPFIQRTKVREKYIWGRGTWWTKQLWYMLNDDEIERYGVDYDTQKVIEKGIDTSTRWGRFKASYWFNAWRNPAYNYSLSHRPVKVTDYSHQSVEINEIFDYNGKKVDPLDRAEWLWVQKDGKISNMGVRISHEHSKLGKGMVWYYPNQDPSLLYFRYSKAFSKEYFGKMYYVTIQFGAWGNKFDVVIKIQKD